MGKFKVLSPLWALLLLCVLQTGFAEENEGEEKHGYIFTAPRSLKTGATNQLQFRRYQNLDGGELTVKVSYTDGYTSNESIAVEKVFNIEEGVAVSHLELFIKPFENYVYNGKITINGTFGDYVIGGVDKVYFGTAKDNIVFIQTDKPLYKEGQTVKFRVLRVNKELKPSTEENADIWVEDPQGTRLFQWKDVSLDKGMKQFEFPLANEPVKGEWKISASFKGDTTSTSFEVKEYVTTSLASGVPYKQVESAAMHLNCGKSFITYLISETGLKHENEVLPKYEVKIEIPPFVLANSEDIPISVCAKYTYGKPVKGNLKLNISLETYAWSNDKLPTLEYEGEIDGCFEYNINVSLIETEDYYRYRRIQIIASVEEYGTGIQRNETQYIQRQYTPLTLSFNREQRQFYKPGLPYNGKLFVKNPDSSPAPDEGIQICYTVTKERIVMAMQWKATRTVKYCQNYTSDAEGIIEFVIPRQNTDSVDINVEAKSLKYAKDTTKKETQRQSSLTQPQTSMSLTPWYSPSGSFIQLQQVQETLLCGTKRKIQLLFTSKTDADFKFHYQVVHQGEVVQRGFVEKSFSVSDDVSSEYEDADKVVDDAEVQIVPSIDPLHPPESEDDQCKSAKDAKYVPPIGVVDFEIEIDPKLSPSFHFLVYYSRFDREIVADSQKFTVEKCYKNQVKMQFGDDVKQPGTKTSIRVTSSPNSLCGIKVVDKSVSLLNSDDQLTTEKIFRILESFDSGMYYGTNHCNEEVRQPGLYKSANGMILPPRPHQPWSSSSYEDSLAAFENAGFLVISDLILFTRPCKSRGGGGNIVFDSDFGSGNAGYGGAVHSKVAMASTARKPAVPQASRPPASDKVGDFETKSVVDVRDYFPDTWLFDLEMTDSDGVYMTKEKLPHTITEWVGSAVCINDEDGLGLSNTTTVKGFQAFFISTTLPYSFIRGELLTITVSIFSYVDKPLPISVALGELDGIEVVGDSPDGDICVAPGTSTNLKIKVKGTALGSRNITVRAESAQSSDVCGDGEVSDALAKDAVTNPIIVEAEGWPAEDIESILFCPKDEENEVFVKTFTLAEAEDIVPDSTRAYFDVTGNVLGKSLDNLENLVQLPTGCGEQNMVKFAPNVVVIEVLMQSNQLSDTTESRIKRNLITGAQRQLQYKHPDGSFSAFGTRDKEGSMFLTAFVLKFFALASKYVLIDNSTIVGMQNWISSKQQENGCFPNVGKIIDRGLQGGMESDKSEGPTTAYVSSALVISGYQNQTVLDKALKCIEDSKDSTFYATFLIAYAEALAGKQDAAKERIKSVRDKAIKKGNGEYFHDVNATTSQDIETTAYAVLSILTSGGSASDVLPLIQYLAQNMNPRGGFYSTQDTVVALECMGEFAKLTFRDEVNILIKTSGGLENEISITEDDKLIAKKYKVETVPSEINVEATGTGCGIIQSVLRYNTKTPPEKRNFNLDVATKCVDDACKRSSVSISLSYIPEGRKTGMSIIEAKMISGVSPVKETLEQLLSDKDLQLMRCDVEDNVIVFYFNEITNNEKNLNFKVERVFPVENPQAGTVTVYDYYNRDISSSTSYTLGKCEDSSSCPKEP